jgi:hypothetical protein
MSMRNIRGALLAAAAALITGVVVGCGGVGRHGSRKAAGRRPAGRSGWSQDVAQLKLSARAGFPP